MNDINFDPNNDLIIPVGFYTHVSKYRCNLIYPMYGKGGWFFPDNYLSLKFQRVFYVFSPSILPLPPNVRTYYTIVKAIEPYNIVKIKELIDPYDFNALINLNNIVSKQHKHKVGIFFGAYRKPVKYTIPMYSYIKNTIGRSLYLSPLEKLHGNWISKFHTNERIISPIFFLDKSTRFKIENNMCYPTPSGYKIEECIKNINTMDTNIEQLQNSNILTSESYKLPPNRINLFSILLLSFFGMGLIIYIIVLFTRNKNL